MNKCVLGNGYIGSAYANAGYYVIGKDQFEYLKDDFDKLEDLLKPFDVVVNCIGKTDTTWSEQPENFDLIWEVNAIFVGKLSKLCKKTGKQLVHISTGDLYGTDWQWDRNNEELPNLDIGTTYRFTKFAGEKFCNSNDLILRIRLPFDGRNHPKNLLVKAQKYTLFYRWMNIFTYVPDLIEATNILLKKNQHGIFNVVQGEGTNILSLQRNIPERKEFIDSINFKDVNDKHLTSEKSNVHVHNDISIAKLLAFHIPQKTDKAWIKSWDELKQELSE